jgi:DNA-binding NarL/FixJ family response regulator
MAATPPAAESTLTAIESLARSGLPAQDLLVRAARHIDRVVPSDGFFLAATDPHTTLCIGAGLVQDLPREMCRPTWDYEYLVPDYLKFADIAHAGSPVADLHQATGGRPERSARWREYASATGFRSELRTAFAVNGAVWGIGQFDRLGDAPRFSDEERAWLGRVAPVLARGLRSAMLTQPGSAPGERGPGLLLLDATGRPVSATREAAEWLDEVESVAMIPTRGDLAMPVEVQAFAAHVRSATGEGTPGEPRRARVRTREGVWLLVHGSPLEGTDQLALIIEPAKAADVAPLIVEAYGLTPRELDVTRAIARGLGTSRIAAHLHLSPHTVRDHVKAIFEKTGVSSRGELVAKMFADHYSPPPHPADLSSAP